MPVDLHLIKKIMPDAKLVFKNVQYSLTGFKNNFIFPVENDNINISQVTGTNFFQFSNMDTIPDITLNVVAPGSEALLNGKTQNLQTALKQKFMSTRHDWKNFEATWYLKLIDKDAENLDDQYWIISGRGGDRRRRNRACSGCSYQAHLAPSGKVRLVKESFTGNTDVRDWKSAMSAPAIDQVFGMKFVCYNINNDTVVRCEIHLDEFNNNNWKLVDVFTDYGNNWGKGASRCGCTNDRQPITWGGPIITMGSHNATNPVSTNLQYQYSNMNVREIDPGGVFAEAGDASASVSFNERIPNAYAHAGGVTVGGGINDGAGGAADDLTIGTGSVNNSEPIFSIQPTGSTASGFPFPFPPTIGGIGGSTSNPIGSPSSGSDELPTTGSNQVTESRPLTTVYKDLGILFDVRFESGAGCSIGSPFAIDYRQIWSTSGVDTIEVKMYEGSGGTIKAGEKLHSSQSVLLNQVIRKVTVPLRRFGTVSTGTVGMEIRNRNGSLMHTFDTTIDPATISTGAFGPTYDFTSDDNKHLMQAGDMLLLTVNGTGGDADNCIILKHTDKDELDGFSSIFVSLANGASTYVTKQSEDFIASMFI